MAVSNENLQTLLQQAEDRERVARRRAAIYSLIPIVLALAMLWFTTAQVQQLAVVNTNLRQAQDNLTLVNNQLAQARQQYSLSLEGLALAQSHLTQTQQQMLTLAEEFSQTQDALTKKKMELELLQQSSAIFVQAATFPTGTRMDLVKFLASPYPAQSTLFWNLIETYRDARWKGGGVSLEEGFDSPGFAAYALEQCGLINMPVASAHYQLQALLPARDQPRVGDVVFYKLGYTMFYFVDWENHPFVLGMTPYGVLAFKTDFAPIIGYGAVNYTQARCPY